MAQQEQQIIINVSQVNQDQKQRLLKSFPKKLLLTFSFLQLAFGFFAILFQVSSIPNHREIFMKQYLQFFRLLELHFLKGTIILLDGVYGQDLCFVFLEVLV